MPTRHRPLRTSSASLWTAGALCVLGFHHALASQTKPQPFFAWTEASFSPSELSARRQRVAAALPKNSVLLVPSAAGRSHGETFRQLDDFWYLTGLELPRSMLVLDGAKGTSTLFVPATDQRFFSPARRNDFPGRVLAKDPEIRKRSGVHAVRPISALGPALQALVEAQRPLAVRGDRGGALPQLGPRLFATPTPVDTLRQYLSAKHPSARVSNAFVAMATSRMVKSKAEIAILRRACAITCASIRETAGAVRPGIDERGLEGILEAGFKKRGAPRIPFASIIKSGPNSLWPWRILAAHYERRNRTLRADELVIFDVGCELKGYATDIGRTFPVTGAFTPGQARALRMATAVADAIHAAVKPGTTLAALQRVAFATIPQKERRYMQTGLFFGHHVGLATGDPTLTAAPLRPGMVFTVEPWYYNHDENIAVFVEDMILVTESGCENLSAALPRDPKSLAAMVGK